VSRQLIQTAIRFAGRHKPRRAPISEKRGNPLDVLDTRQKNSVLLASLIWPPKVQMVDPILF
jgi:hypothetical protein